MELVIVNRSFTKANVSNESVYNRIALMYCESLRIRSIMADMIGMWVTRTALKEKNYCMLYANINKVDVDEWLQFYSDIVQLRKNKNKPKELIVAHQQMEKLLKSLVREVIIWMENIIDNHKLKPLIDLFENNVNKTEQILMVKHNDAYNEDATHQDPIIEDLVLSFHDRNIFILDPIIEKLVDPQNFFHSIELFEFPHLHELSFQQLLHIRNELKPVFKNFFETIKTLDEEFKGITYQIDKDKIEPLLEEKIAPFINDIQLSINKNIFIQQQQNKFSETQRIKVIFCVTSIENLIHLLEKEEVIMPFVANAIIDILSKTNDIKTAIPFIYHKLPDPIIVA